MKNYCFLYAFAFVLIINTACDPESLLKGNNKNTVKSELATDYEWSDSEVISITLNSNSIEATSSTVSINGTTATITKEGHYSISGSLTNGQIVVNADSGIVKIELNGANLNSTTGSPFYIKNANKTIVFLKEGTTNTITDAATYSNSEEPNATIFSNGYLAFTGTGTLIVKGNYNDGISSDDEVIINSGTINVTAKDDAIRGKDFLKVNGGIITTTSTFGHALKADNENDKGLGFVQIEGGTLNMSSSSADGIHATKRVIINNGEITISAPKSQGLHSDSLVLINGGNTILKSSNEGIESPYITMNDGNLSIAASDDGLNATFGNGGESNDKSMITIAGGFITINVAGGDGIDSNGNASMTGGTILVHGPSSQPEVAIDVNGDFKISGGLLMASGPNSGNMIEGTSTSSAQYSALIKFGASSGQFGGGPSGGTNPIAAGTIINIRDSNGKSLVCFASTRACYYVVFSSPELKSGSSYSVYTGITVTGGTNSNGYYTGGTYTGGTLKGTFTVSSKLSTVTFN